MAIWDLAAHIGPSAARSCSLSAPRFAATARASSPHAMCSWPAAVRTLSIRPSTRRTGGHELRHLAALLQRRGDHLRDSCAVCLFSDDLHGYNGRGDHEDTGR
ncbi:hypothetical protein P8C59_005761 [Phyllachora maydis]|uniref:Uncharacterized protein n=1 Tax=Phyllachora maydis TaxID=1825666 RepID=A0AAD9MCK1_9PEZI|nr:hypothetical protein P8C59_005761 [Phyllachora maydis]